MKEMTRNNLQNAFAGESQAHMKYLIFAEVAENEGFKNVARIFRAAAYAEQIHATNHLKTLGQVGKTEENLNKAIEGETFEVNEMYPSYIAVAENQGESAAKTSFKRAMEAEKIHAELYKKALDAVKQGKDATIGKIFVCSVCGYTIEGEAPDKCPICGAPKDKFKEF